MDWRRDGTKELYLLDSPTFHCQVYHASTGSWLAMVRYGEQRRTKEDFPTAEAARQWCEQRVLLGKAGKPI